jgi:hypothetical protein
MRVHLPSLNSVLYCTPRSVIVNPTTHQAFGLQMVASSSCHLLAAAYQVERHRWDDKLRRPLLTADLTTQRQPMH